MLQSVGVMLLGALAWWQAHKFSGPKRIWIGLVPSLLYLGVLLFNRWVPDAEPGVIGAWIMAGRNEYALGAFALSILLLAPCPYLRLERQRWLLRLCTASIVFYFSILPFLAPAFEFGQQSKYETTLVEDGICLQSNGYNCGPAAAVTVLGKLGIKAEEGQLALAAYTTPYAGTPPDLLCKAVEKLYCVDVELVSGNSLSELKELVPFIALVKYTLTNDHYVAVLEISDTHVRLGDPLKGGGLISLHAFHERWKRKSIVFNQGSI